MGAVVAESAVLKLTVDDRGKVWYLDGSGLPRSSNASPKDFLCLPLARSASKVRVVGAMANAILIVELFSRKCRGEMDSLEVCSPLCCESAEDRKDPELVLYNMRTYNLSPSLGGWHEFTQQDYSSYALAEHFIRGGSPDAYTRRLLQEHPAWTALSFVANVNEAGAGRLLALIVDPRWYVDDEDPNRGSKMEQYLGINPKTQAGVSVRNEQTWLHDRCRLVLSCWKGAMPPKVATSPSPRNFLWRVWANKGGGYKGDLGASKVFASFLRLTWTNAVATDGHRGHLFIPEHFFTQKDEVEAYKRHMTLGGVDVVGT